MTFLPQLTFFSLYLFYTYCRIGASKVIKEVSIMAYVINDGCVSCGACASECPVGAISEGADKYVIDAGACLECGACADACPTDSIEG
jgi:ferredoxin